MMSEPAVTVSVAPADLAQASAVSHVARTLDAPEIIEYWKSAPYLLNFMRHYSLKRLLEDQADAPSADAPRRHPGRRTDHARSRRHRRLRSRWSPANGRMRAIMDDVFGQQPRTKSLDSCRHALLRRRAIRAPLTKALIFSVLVHGARRHRGPRCPTKPNGGWAPANPADAISSSIACAPCSSGRIRGASLVCATLLLIYPSPTLAELADPLAVFAETRDSLVTGGHARRHRAIVSSPPLDASAARRSIAGCRTAPNGPPRP